MNQDRLSVCWKSRDQCCECSMHRSRCYQLRLCWIRQDQSQLLGQPCWLRCWSVVRQWCLIRKHQWCRGCWSRVQWSVCWTNRDQLSGCSKNPTLCREQHDHRGLSRCEDQLCWQRLSREGRGWLSRRGRRWCCGYQLHQFRGFQWYRECRWCGWNRSCRGGEHP